MEEKFFQQNYEERNMSKDKNRSINFIWLTLSFMLWELPYNICLLFPNVHLTPIKLFNQCLKQAKVRPSCCRINRELFTACGPLYLFLNLGFLSWINGLAFFFLSIGLLPILGFLFGKLSFLELFEELWLGLTHCFNHLFFLSFKI